MMEYQTWSQRKFWLVMVGMLFLGMIISPKGTTSEVADTNVQTLSAQAVKDVEAKTQGEIKEVQAQGQRTIQQLDAIDQEIFSLSHEVIDAQSTALQTAGVLVGQYPFIAEEEIKAATGIILEQTERVKTATRQLEPLQAKRSELLGM